MKDFVAPDTDAILNLAKNAVYQMRLRQKVAQFTYGDRTYRAIKIHGGVQVQTSTKRFVAQRRDPACFHPACSEASLGTGDTK